jgi:hypothetical protein
MFLNKSASACLLSQLKQSANDFMQYKIIQRTHWQAQKIVFSYNVLGSSTKTLWFYILHLYLGPNLVSSLDFPDFSPNLA